MVKVILEFVKRYSCSLELVTILLVHLELYENFMLNSDLNQL